MYFQGVENVLQQEKIYIHNVTYGILTRKPKINLTILISQHTLLLRKCVSRYPLEGQWYMGGDTDEVIGCYMLLGPS